MEQILFPFADYWWAYVGFVIFVCSMLALDLGVFHRKAHAVSIKEAAIWTVIWISLGLVFNLLFYLYSLNKFSSDPNFLSIWGMPAADKAKQVALEFLTGLVIEKSLAIDNIFVFVLVFAYFGIPLKYQHRVLFFGILGALVFRAIFIALGSILMQFHWVLWVFGGFLIFTGVKMAFGSETKIDPDKSLLVRWVRKFYPVTSEFHDQKFFVKLEGVKHVTPLFLALIFLEISDIIFAVDSVPAIFALTKEPFIVFTSNIFAILGLRSMYFLLAGMVDRFEYLKYGLSLVLIFVGCKMTFLNEMFGGKFPVTWSLTIILTLILGSGLFSWLKTRRAHNN